MHKRFYLSVILIAALLLSILVAPVLAQDDDERFRHTVRYIMDGRITIDRQLGHACNTGAVKFLTVRGFGEMTRTESVRIAPHIIAVDDETEWTTAEDALQNLTVTVTFDLCARPKSAAAHAYTEDGYNIQPGDIINVYHPLVVSGDLAVTPLTDQVWSTRISPDPGEEGIYESDFRAAYGPGPFEEMYGEWDELGEVTFYDDVYRWWFDPAGQTVSYDSGRRYVGNFVELDQYAYTSGGEFERFFSVSSPFSGAVLIEDLSVTGRAEVRESFELDNLDPGPDAITLLWHDIF